MTREDAVRDVDAADMQYTETQFELDAVAQTKGHQRSN